VLDRPVDGRDDLRDVDRAVARADLEVHQGGVGRDPGEARGVQVGGRRPGGVPAGDDGGHVRPVAEGIQVRHAGLLAVERQVRTVHHIAAG
jgi:hypothetical protein